MNVETVGFAGLGRMGGPMAGRLVAAGHRLIGFDVAGTRERLPAGAHAVETLGDLAAQADTIFLSVPSGVASREICHQIVAASERRARTVVDLSTIGIVAARECAGLLDGAGVAYVDAPVSGGVAGARSGSLAMMVGASAAALAATCEATVFGARLGLDLDKMVAVLNVSSGRSAASENKFPKSIIPQTYDFGFAGVLMAKDVTLYLEDAMAAGVPHELAAAITAVWQRFNAAHPGADFTYIHKYFEDGGL